MPRQPALAAVTGIGCVCAAGDCLEAVLDNLEANPPVPAPPRRFAGLGESHPVFETEASPNPPSDHGLTLLMESAFQALAVAGLSPGELAGKRVGVCIGSSVGFAINYFPLYQAWKQGEQVPVEPLEAFRCSNYALALAKRLGLVGPCQLVANACASGTDAIGVGATWIASGLCDLVLAGGAESLSSVSYLGFIRLMIADTKPCRPFDRARNGLNLGEGAAVLVLEPAGTTRSVAGAVLGYGTAGDAYHPTAPHPHGRGLRCAFKTALRQAGVAPRGVAFVNAHGTATQDNDKVEGLVLGDMFPGVPVLATKGATGHALGAAGAIEAAITLGCLGRGTIPASPGFVEPDPALAVIPTTRSLALGSRIAVSDSLAFGGCNAALVLGGERS
ncbi:Beta-ketoacyl-acyl-carrier-protein synthase I [Solidesulfovibrio carbinoliphilus subsp. oakridgensis]|uniref:Beta-ketoacyl-acyl-carrier-protein synthase I n=1 Tax=Solidesulfovibrio carbinoliphilus subsp. oakridgensis TaxID=694327 RepID=G7QBI4_9BACT|nr:beta-ketoacyl synthase N-terminal-like domain-containing protein [Solidesulfovibrio carbinoliphilus]EHJ48847.1 Beta-ketoacyl-acyl-carrier-protein synthase I [Solidesulfovibrio carbinoliphilus subsp. oakridgensis]